MFAKLYETEDLGQLLIVVESSEDSGCEAQLKMTFHYQGMSISPVCQFADDNQGDGWEKAEKAFQEVDEAKARAWAESMIDLINETLEEE